MKKIISIFLCFLLVFPTLVSCSEKDNSTGTKDYYKLSYYDGLDQELGYNNNLFYENDTKKAGADPSVIYGKSSDGNDYFYVYTTGNMRSIYGYRSTNLADWTGTGLVFVPESNSWAQSVIWAPDVIYDPNVDDGMGGKGLYYLFFTAADSFRSANGSLYFDSRADRASFMQIKMELKAQADNEVIEKLSYSGTFNQKVAELCAEYSVQDDSIVEYLLGLYNANKNSEELRKDITSVEIQKNIANYAREALLGIRTANVHSVGANSQGSYAGMVATAKTLDGPFVQYTNDGEDGNRALAITEPFFAHEDLYGALSAKYNNIDKCLNIVDLHPFIDPETGDKYMYFNSNPLAPHTINSVAEIFVVKVGDKDSRWTDDWQWNTVKQLTRTGYYDMGENENPKRTDKQTDLGESAINEGAYVIYNEVNEKYYLTVSKGAWKSASYAVVQAVSDSPMGPFKKFSREDGGLLLQTETTWKHAVGPGHHSFIEHNGKTYIVYHKHMKEDASGDRAFAVDEIKWIKNGDGEWIMYCNGPTVSPQPKMDSGYSNITDKATVKADKGKNAKSLTDGLISATSELNFVKEYSSGTGYTTITLDFNAYRTVRALMIYNSRDYDKAFKEIYRIEMDFISPKEGETVKGTVYIDNLKFNEKYFYELYNQTYVIPGTAAIAEFEEIKVKTIRIILNTSKAVNVSEIVVLGR